MKYQLKYLRDVLLKFPVTRGSKLQFNQVANCSDDVADVEQKRRSSSSQRSEGRISFE